MARPFRLLLLVAVATLGLGWSSASAVPINGAAGVEGSASATQVAVRGERVQVLPPAPAVDPMLLTVLQLTNAERAAVGLPALTLDPLLTVAAQVHSDDQARRNTLTHYGENGETPGDRISATGYRFRTWAENAAMGYRSAEAVMNGWMNSPGHRANVLRASVTEIGLGLSYSSHGVPYWTQVFAAPR